MINFKHITQAIETLFTAELGNDFSIERNPVRPSDPVRVMRSGKDGWIGIYRGPIKYAPHSTGPINYMADIEIMIEIQVASTASADDCEDRLADAEKRVIDVLELDRKGAKLGGYIDNIIGFDIDYEMNQNEATYYQAAIITIKAEQRTGL